MVKRNRLNAGDNVPNIESESDLNADNCFDVLTGKRFAEE